MSHRDSPKMQGILKNDDVQPASPSSLLGIGLSRSPRADPKCTFQYSFRILAALQNMA